MINWNKLQWNWSKNLTVFQERAANFLWPKCFNTLTSADAMQCHKTLSTLVQIMAWHRQAPRYYLIRHLLMCHEIIDKLDRFPRYCLQNTHLSFCHIVGSFLAGIMLTRGVSGSLATRLTRGAFRSLPEGFSLIWTGRRAAVSGGSSMVTWGPSAW